MAYSTLEVGRQNKTKEELNQIYKNRYRTWYDGSGIIIFNAENHILLVQDAYTKKWSFPKGRVEKEDDDNPIITAIRETKEECGLECNTDYILNSIKPHFVKFNTYFFIASLLDSAREPMTDGEHEGAYRWCSPSYIKKEIWYNTNVYIKEFVSKFM
jgi:8-oxo-dGTP pyrophosphatase MutT (NUDIX family)